MNSKRGARGRPNNRTQARRSLASKPETSASEPEVTYEPPKDLLYLSVEQTEVMEKVVQEIRHDMNLLDFRDMIPPAVQTYHQARASAEIVNSVSATGSRSYRSILRDTSILAIVGSALSAVARDAIEQSSAGFDRTEEVRCFTEFQTAVAQARMKYAHGAVVVIATAIKDGVYVQGAELSLVKTMAAVVPLHCPLGISIASVITSLKETMEVKNKIKRSDKPIHRVMQLKIPSRKKQLSYPLGTALVVRALTMPALVARNGFSALDWSKYVFQEIPYDLLDWAHVYQGPRLTSQPVLDAMVWDPEKQFRKEMEQVGVMFEQVWLQQESDASKIESLRKELRSLECPPKLEEKIMRLVEETQTMSLDEIVQKAIADQIVALLMAVLRGPDKPLTWHETAHQKILQLQ